MAEPQGRRTSVVELSALDAMHRRLSTRWSVAYRQEVNEAGMEDVTGLSVDYGTLKKRRFPALRTNDPLRHTVAFEDRSKPSVLARLGIEVTKSPNNRRATEALASKKQQKQQQQPASSLSMSGSPRHISSTGMLSKTWVRHCALQCLMPRECHSFAA